jgi:hypothetical protein
MSTHVTPPHPTTSATTGGSRRWTRTVRVISGREVWVWRAVIATLLVLAAVGTLARVPGAALVAVLMLGPAALVAEGQVSWWVRRR